MCLPARTNRFLINTLSEADRADVIGLLQDADVQRFIVQTPIMDAPLANRQFHTWMQRDTVFSIRTATDAAFVGICGVTRAQRQLFIAVVPMQRGGVAEEVIPDVVRIFRLQFPREGLFARADRANARSIRICRRLGFAELRPMETDAEIFFRILPVADNRVSEGGNA